MPELPVTNRPTPPQQRPRAAGPSRRLGTGMAGMRWIDHWIGLPVCTLFGLFATIVRQLGWKRSREIHGDRTFAVFKFFGLGSIIEATPLLRAIRQRYPGANLAFITFAGNEALLRRLNICTDIRVIRTNSPINFVADVFRQIIWLQRQSVEAVIDLEFFSKFSTLLAFLSGARIRTGFHLNDFWRYSLITHPVYFNYYRHITDIYAEAGRVLGVEVTDTNLTQLDPGDEARARVANWLTKHACPPNAPLLGMNVNAGDLCPERRWPASRFADLIERLLADSPNLYIVQTGTPDERPHVEHVIAKLSAPAKKRVLNAAGDWSLGDFLAGLERFAWYVTNDSGPMHFAAAAGVPMVSLWGPGRPDFYAPKLANHRTVYADYPCSPCLYMFTTFEAMWCDHEGWCMQALSTDHVHTVVRQLIVDFPAISQANN